MSKEREAYEANPKLCKECGGPIPYEKRRQTYCSSDCQHKSRMIPEDQKKHRDRREYLRQWREAHKEQEKERHHENYLNNKDKILARNREYAETHKEQKAIYDAIYRQKNKDKIAAQQAAYQKKKKLEKNPNAKSRKICLKCGNAFMTTDPNEQFCILCRNH